MSIYKKKSPSTATYLSDGVDVTLVKQAWTEYGESNIAEDATDATIGISVQPKVPVAQHGIKQPRL